MLKISKTNLSALVVFFFFIHQLALAQNSPHDVQPEKIKLDSKNFEFDLDFSNVETGRNAEFVLNIGGCRLNFWSNLNNLMWIEEIGERTIHGQPYFDPFYFNSILNVKVDESSVNVAAKNDEFTNYQRRNLCKVQLDDKSNPGKFILEASLSGTYIFSNFEATIGGQKITKHIVPSTTSQSTSSTATQSTSRTATQSVSSTATQPTSNTTTQQLTPTHAAKEDEKKLFLPLWAIIVISVSVGLLILASIVGLIVCCCCRCRRSKQPKKVEKTEEKKETVTTSKSTAIKSKYQEPAVGKRESTRDANVFTDNDDIEAVKSYNLRSKSISHSNRSSYLDQSMKGL